MSAYNQEDLIKETQNAAIDKRMRDGKIAEARIGNKGVTAAFETGKEKMKVIPQIITESMKQVCDPKIWQAMLEKMGLGKPLEAELGKS